MESLYLLVPLALIFLVLAIRLLFWAVNSGQYEDLNTEGHRILFDEKTSATKSDSIEPHSKSEMKGGGCTSDVNEAQESQKHTGQ